MDSGHRVTTLYAESSAVLRWLLGAPDAPKIRVLLERADEIITSALTPAEVGRTLARLLATAALSDAEHDRLRLRFAKALAHWSVYGVTDAILVRAAGPFPAEPLRTMDAIHVATVDAYGREVGAPAVLSVDQRVRDNVAALGFSVLPRTTAARRGKPR